MSFASCKKDVQSEPKKLDPVVLNHYAHFAVDEIYAKGVPDALPPDYCIVGPSSCGIVARTGVYTDLEEAVLEGSYGTWLSNSTNYQALLSDFPGYEDLIDQVISEEKVMVYYEEPGANRIAILMGDPNGTDIDNHDGSIIIH